MERLFSLDQLVAIETEADRNEDIYLESHVIDGEATELSIITISKANKLIFTEGNSDTGWKHLKDRHDYYSLENYWQATEEDKKLDNPSKFHPRMMPIIDFVKVADAIFLAENKNVTNNSRPDIFDKYTGHYRYSENEKYHLITYKNTRVVHSLFPDKKKHNRKRKCRFGKGDVNTLFKYPEGFNDLIVPYENSDNKVAYSIVFRRYLFSSVEDVFVKRNATGSHLEEVYHVASAELGRFEKFEREDMYKYQYGDLRQFEDIINQIEQYHTGSEH